MPKFEVVSEYQPAGDQPEAIAALSRGLEMGLDEQTLLGVTGSGKTFTMANVIAQVNRPTLVLAHNKTLAAQHRDDSLEDAMLALGVGTREELLEAVRIFQAWRSENPEPAQAQERTKKDDEEPNDQLQEELAQSSVNDTAMFVIDNVVRRSRLTNRYDVMERFCAVLEHRFGTGAKLDENLEKMHLATTKDVLQAIDIYFVMKDLYPDTVFGRKRMQSVWAPVFQELSLIHI